MAAPLSSPVDLMAEILRFQQDANHITELRKRFFSPQTDLDAVFAAAQRRQLTALMIERLGSKGIIHPAPSGHTGGPPLRRQIGQLSQGHKTRRARLTAQLADLAGLLNGAGIVPLMLKGAATLVTGEPSWREQRDIDFAVRPEQVTLTNSVLRQNGFEECVELGEDYHHLSPLARSEDLVMVEPHTRINGNRSMHLLPDNLLWEASVEVGFADHRVRLLRPDHFVLQGIAHHHFQNQGGTLEVINVKGLLEFLDAITRLSYSDMERLLSFLNQSPLFQETVELWCAAGQHVLGANIPTALLVSEDARRRAETLWGNTPRTIGFFVESDAAPSRMQDVVPGRERFIRPLLEKLKAAEQTSQLSFYAPWPVRNAARAVYRFVFRRRILNMKRKHASGIMLFDEER
jgi:hypothetical protein